MDQDIKKKWVDALRSGDYDQVLGALKREQVLSETGLGYCCLGVLCEVMGVENEKKEEGTVYDFLFPRGGWSSRETTMPEPGWAEDIGLDWNTAHYLAKMNDDGESFEVIARYVEENVH